MSTNVTELIIKGTDDASAAFEAVGSGAAGLATATAAFAATGGAVAVAAIGAIGVAAVAMSLEFDAAMNLFQAQTGSSDAAMADFEGTALSLFNQNFGESLGDVAESMAAVNAIIGLTGPELETATSQALILRDVFDKDVAESVRAVDTATENFGATSSEVFDLLTTTIQQTGDPADDLLDTINEYSADFAEAGFSAQDMFTTLIAGTEAGAFNMDKVADSVREFTTRIVDGSDLTAEALDTIGVDADNLFAGFQDGSVTAADAMTIAIDALEAMTDPIAQDAAGVALFGSMWEDLGSQAIFALNDTVTGLEDVAGATLEAGDTVNQGLGPAFETFKRTMETSLLPLGDVIGDVLLQATPHLQSLADWLTDKIPVAVETLRAFWVDDAWPAILDTAAFITTEIVPVLQTVAAEVIGLAETWLGNWQQIQGDTETTLLVVQEFINTGLETIRGWWDEHGQSVMTIVTVMTDTVEQLFDSGVAFVQDVVTTGLDLIQSFWDDHGTTVQTVIENTWDSIQSAFEAGVTIISDLIDATAAALTGDWTAFGEEMRAVTDTAWAAIQDIVSNGRDTIRAIVTDLVGTVVNLFTTTNWGALGQNIIDGLVGTIQGGASDVIGAVVNIAAAAEDAIKAFFGISSDSRLMQSVAADFVAGFTNTVAGSAGLVANAVTEMASGVEVGLTPLTIGGGRQAGGFQNQLPALTNGGNGGNTVTIQQVNIQSEAAMRIFIDFINGQRDLNALEAF